MFGQFFGRYLTKSGRLTQEQLGIILEQQKATRIKLGLIAVSEKLLTEAQTEEINRLQAQMDKRFGDIAVEKGYLTKDQVAYLLSFQGNPYLSFLQVLEDKNYMNMAEAEEALTAFAQEYGYTKEQLDALKSGDIDRITPIFVHMEETLYREHISLGIRNIIRFISSDLAIEQAYRVNEYAAEVICYQQLKGDHSMLFGFAGEESALLPVAEAFAKESFETMDEDACDSVCEFINCIDGLYASELSERDVNVDMCPPLFGKKKSCVTTGLMYIVPLQLAGGRVDILLSMDSDLVIKSNAK